MVYSSATLVTATWESVRKQGVAHAPRSRP